LSKLKCDRCGAWADNLYPITVTNSLGENINWKICWDCDWEISNGRDPFADIIDILEDRRENEVSF